ncbi:MAG: alanyl-tRNA editing protein [Deltaproteobacteria bacterium]|nr:alanyl-tRNA editing protein [Deltaproteobacteria bacterium]
MPTTLLYHRDPLLLTFDAQVSAHGTHDRRATVVLDQTAFYPEAGGQMADRGALRVGEVERRVLDVQVDEAGLVHHLLDDGAPPAVGAAVSGVVDGARRRLFMALHTGQHLLSHALLTVARADTASSRLGESACTVDIDVPALADSALREAEALVNQVIDEDLAVHAWFPDERELAALPLRRRPKVADNIRVVAIGGRDGVPLIDASPCGGTHCTRTAQIGVLSVAGAEKYKGKTRVSFSAGARARRELLDQVVLLRALAAQLSCGPLDVVPAFDKLRRDVLALREGTKQLVEQVAAAAASELVAAQPAPAPIVAVLGDKELMRAIAAQLMSREGRHALLAANDGDGLHVVCARGPGSSFDCAAFLKELTRAHGGKGGGKPERAEGRLPGGLDWHKLTTG